MSNVRILILGFACVAFISCGDISDSNSGDGTIHATLMMTNAATNSENGMLELTSVDECNVDPDTGRADFSFSSGRNRSLVIAIKNMTSTPGTYTCAQASDNALTMENLGLKFDGCMVEVSKTSSGDTTTNNSYSMHRIDTNIKLFNYDGTCTIETTEISSTISGDISCTSMVQTVLDGAARNPISEQETLDLTGNFSCTRPN